MKIIDRIVNGESLPEVVTILGDILQLLGDIVAFILDKISDFTRLENLRDYIPIAILTTSLGNMMQALGSLLGGIREGSFEITHILPIIGNTLQATGGIIEFVESLEAGES